MINETIGPREDYTNLELTISRPPRARSRYQAWVHISGWRYFEPCRFTLDLSSLAATAEPAAFGRALGEAFFQKSPVGKHYGETLAVVQGRGDGLRVRLVLEPPELQGLAWERIYQQIDGEWRPLGSTAATPFSRYIRPQQWERPVPVTQRPLKALVVIASPAGLEAEFGLDDIAVDERQRLKNSLASLPELEVTCLESGTASPPTLNEIRRRLAEGFHLVHFLGHGAHTPQGTALFLEADPSGGGQSGSVDPVDQDRLVEAFKVLKEPPVLVFLAACESAKRSRSNANLPLGPALVEDGGVQAVVAMTAKVGLNLAQTFAAQFYTRLLKHGVIDLAVNEARALVKDDWDWGVPVLFSRLEDNQLLDFPVGRFYDVYLSHTDQAFLAIDEAVSAARLEAHGQTLMADLQELVNELSKSHGVLVDVASKFRRTGRDPQDFAQKFEAFYYEFKDYFDRQTWVHESTSCNRIGQLRHDILPRLAPLLSDANFDRLQQELDMLSNADNDLVRYFGEYLNLMDQAVEGIWASLDAGRLDEAIQRKRDFEAQISPSLQRSKEMFERMSTSLRGVQAA